jgi:hypothetical protein
MATFIDRRLMEKLSAAGESGRVEAIIVVKENGGSSPAIEDGGLARQVIEGTAEQTGEHPNAVRYFPRANAAVIAASGRFIQEILKNENLAVASATEVNTLAVLKL